MVAGDKLLNVSILVLVLCVSRSSVDGQFDMISNFMKSARLTFTRHIQSFWQSEVPSVVVKDGDGNVQELASPTFNVTYDGVRDGTGQETEASEEEQFYGVQEYYIPEEDPDETEAELLHRVIRDSPGGTLPPNLENGPDCTGSSESCFFNYGTNYADTCFDDDIAGRTGNNPLCWELQFAKGILLNDQVFFSYYICEVGHIDFGTKQQGANAPGEQSSQNSFQNDFILPVYWRNMRGGSVCYHCYTRDEDGVSAATLFANVEKLVLEEFNTTFQAEYILKITWSEMTQYGQTGQPKLMTFQAVIAGNCQETYAFYFYQERTEALRGKVFIGRALASNALYDRKLDSSPQKTILGDPYENVVTNSRKGLMVYDLAPLSGTGVQNNVCACLDWVEDETTRPLQTLYAAVPDCPCTVAQVLVSQQFSETGTGDIEYVDGTYCTQFAQNFQSSSYTTLNRRCCYRQADGTLKDDGYFTINPTADLDMYGTCCIVSENPETTCPSFYSVRQATANCTDTSNTRIATGVGDPHIVTLDNFFYTFNGLGEFDLILWEQDGTMKLQVQARTELAESVDATVVLATLFSALAFKDQGGETVTVQLNYKKDALVLYMNDIDRSLAFNNLAEAFMKTTQNLVITRQNDGSMLVRDVQSEINFVFRVQNKLLEFKIYMETNSAVRGNLKGLLGNFNGDTEDDMIPRGSTTPIASTSSDADIFNYAMTWQTSEAESVFHYDTNKGWSDYQDSNFRPKFLSNFTDAEIADASLTCEAEKACMYDMLLTNNENLALDTKAEKETAEAEYQIAVNRVPSIEVVTGLDTSAQGYAIEVTKDQEATFSLKATDDGTALLKLGATTDIPGITLSDKDAQDVQVVTFTLTSDVAIILSIYAEDNKAARSPALPLTITFCTGCNSRGTCDFTTLRNDVRATSQFVYAACECTPYYSGKDCESDFNACSESPCSSLRTCADKLPTDHENSGVGYTCTNCPAGYTNDGDSDCTDIDECTTTPGVCAQACTNNDGGYTCSCNEGYRYINDLTCQDINECDEGTDGCTQLCTNEVGSFTCSCRNGYTLNADGKTCDADTADPCEDVTSDCGQAKCYVNDPSGANEAVCFCDLGYDLDTAATPQTCNDVNECNQGLCSHSCTNNDGSYVCSCFTGYYLDTDKRTCLECPFPSFGVDCSGKCLCGLHSTGCNHIRGCECKPGWSGAACNVDINECDVNKPCGGTETCVNTLGSYRCDCPAGFTKSADGQSCVDINECTAGNHDCQQVCVNADGTYSCSCNAGFAIDPTDNKKCKDIDECTSGTSGCTQLCINHVDGYNCDCHYGYIIEDDRKTCTLVDDACATFEDKNCDHICVVAGNTSSCTCRAGYTLGGDLQTCYDVDECSSATANECQDKTRCVNSPAGSYTCGCGIGLKLDNDQRTCVVCEEGFYGENCASQCDCGTGMLDCDPVQGCICKDGLFGEKCDQDVDECSAATSPCTDAFAKCINNIGSYVCQCIDGYELVNGACADINECNDPDLNTCQQGCANTDGGFTCSCSTGYTLQADQSCLDIDECLGAHGCSHTCTNMPGTFRCSCRTGYHLDTITKKNCIADATCTAGACAANAECALVTGNPVCSCQHGYQGADATASGACNDIDECDGTDPCSDKCNNEPGSFTCSCTADGFKLDADGWTCIPCEDGKYGANCAQTCTCTDGNTQSCDKATGTCQCNTGWEGQNCETNIDECSQVALHNCPANSVCQDSPGSFTCKCNTGFAKTGTGECKACDGKTRYGDECGLQCECAALTTESCNTVDGTCTCLPGWEGNICDTDIDECALANCEGLFKGCDNTPGSFACTCRDGFGFNAAGDCEDVDECTLGTDACQQNCTNTAGAYECSCEEGYNIVDTVKCEDIDECADATLNQCSETDTCQNTPGSYTCACSAGYALDSDGRTCNDVNECETDNGGCSQNCTNTVGSFVCSCHAGYTGDVQCADCPADKFDMACSGTCDCITANAATDRVCHRETGVCNCLPIWSGTRCADDVNECDTTTHGCNATEFRGCYNTQGGHECACIVGYQPNGDVCEPITVTTTVAPPAAGEKASTVSATFNHVVAGSDFINVAKRQAEYILAFDTELTRVYEASMGTNLKAVDVTSVTGTSGQLVVDYSVTIADSDAASVEFAQASAGLGTGAERVTVFGQEGQVVAITMNNNTATENNLDSYRCFFYEETINGCSGDATCVVENNLPVCRATEKDDLPLILGLGLGIPLFLLAVAIIALLACLAYRRNRGLRKRGGSSITSSDSIFASRIPTAYHGRPGYSGYRGAYDLEQYSEASADPREHYRRNRAIPSQLDPGNLYDNSPKDSNFSWDFMYNFMGPDEEGGVTFNLRVSKAIHGYSIVYSDHI